MTTLRHFNGPPILVSYGDKICFLYAGASWELKVERPGVSWVTGFDDSSTPPVLVYLEQPAPEAFKLNNDKSVAVSTDCFYHPMSTCPLGVCVLLLNLGGAATFGVYDGKDTQWQGWFPLPKVPPALKP